MKAEIFYKENLRTEATHVQSGSNIETDAPTDNNGKGERFSPTDLVASATVSCMLTIAGIVAEQHKFSIAGAKGSVQKIMGTNPRRITELIIKIQLPEQLNEKQRKLAEAGIKGCPVVESLHPEIQIQLSIQYTIN